MKKWVAAVIASSMTSVTAADLLEVFKLARSRDPVYATARATWAAAQEKIPQGRALLLPAISASANTNYNDREIAFRNGTSAPGRFNSNGYTVALTQPIYRMQNNIQYSQAQLLALQADMQLAAASQDLMLRVTQAYFDILLMQDTLELAQAQKEVIGHQLAQAKISFDVGAGVSTDVHEAQARYDLVVSQEVMARNDLLVKRRALNAIIAMQPETLAPLGPGFKLEEPQPNDVRYWVERGLSNSPQVAAQRYALDIAGEEIKRNHYGHYPTLDAVASYGRNNAGSGILGGVGYDITTKVVGVQVAVPIYQGGSITSKTREAAANEGKAREELETVSRQIAFVVEQAFASVVSGVEQVQALRAALSSTEKQVNATQIGRNEGARSSIDLLNAQQQLFQSRKDLAQAQYNYLMNRLRLSAAAGEIGEEDLLRVNGMLAAVSSPGNVQTVSLRVSLPPAATKPAPVSVLPAASVKREARMSDTRIERISGMLLSIELGSRAIGTTVSRAEPRHAASGVR